MKKDINFIENLLTETILLLKQGGVISKKNHAVISKLQIQLETVKKNYKKNHISPIVIRTHTDACSKITTQVELLDAGSDENGNVNTIIDLNTMRFHITIWEKDYKQPLTQTKVMSNWSSNQFSPIELRVLRRLIQAYPREIQSAINTQQGRNSQDCDGWSSIKLVPRYNKGRWYLVESAQVSIPPVITEQFSTELIDWDNNKLSTTISTSIHKVIKEAIKPIYLKCSNLPLTWNINLPSRNSKGEEISVAQQNIIGNSIQTLTIDLFTKNGIPISDMIFSINTNAVSYPSIVITSP